MRVLATLWSPVSLLESRIRSTFYSTTNISHRDTLNKWQIANFALDQLWDHFFNIPILNQPYMWNTQGMCLPTQDAGTAAWLGLHAMRAFSHTVLYRLTNLAIYSEHSWMTGFTLFITVSEKMFLAKITQVLLTNSCKCTSVLGISHSSCVCYCFACGSNQAATHASPFNFFFLKG